MPSTRRPKNDRFSMTPKWLLTHPAVVGNRHALRVFAWIDVQYANAEGRAYLKQERLAKDLGLSVDSLQRATAALREAGALRTALRYGSSGAPSHMEYLVIHDRPSRKSAAWEPSLNRKLASDQAANLRLGSKEEPEYVNQKDPLESVCTSQHHGPA
jgi:hypothetical protein